MCVLLCSYFYLFDYLFNQLFISSFIYCSLLVFENLGMMLVVVRHDTVLTMMEYMSFIVIRKKNGINIKFIKLFNFNLFCSP